MFSKMVILFCCLLTIPFLLVVIALVQNDLPWTASPGALVRLGQYLGNNDISTSPESLYPELHPREYKQTDETIFDSVKQALHQPGWEIVEENVEARLIHAVITTSLFKFKDDIYITINKAGNNNVVNIRSKSRVGKGDLGTNTRHIMNFYAALDKIISDKNNKQNQ